MNPNKRRLAQLMARTGLSRLGHRVQTALLSPFVRVVNYHDVPPSQAEGFERHLRRYARDFTPVGYADLLRLAEGAWRPEKPGLILSFDDGFRSHAEVCAPLLERHGFPGWFFVPTGLVDTPPEAQPAAARAAKITPLDPDARDPRLFLTWDQVRALDAAHVVGCHTVTHRRLAADVPLDVLRHEIAGGKAALEARLGREVPVFCWVGGEAHSYSAQAAALIEAAGFRVSFMTNNAPVRPGTDLLHLQRTNIEARDADWLVEFQLSGLLDLLYTPKRRRIDRLTARGAGSAAP